MSNTLDGCYVLLQKGNPVFWSQKGPDGDEYSGLVLALTHEDAQKWAKWFYEKNQIKVSPYLVGSAGDNDKLNQAEFKAHDLGESLDIVFVIDFQLKQPRFWYVPPSELPSILSDEEDCCSNEE